MSTENTDGVGQQATPSRRAVLKAAVAGGAFAVPLIASFSMDAASAQTHVARSPVSNQFVVSNMVCSNQSFVAPNGFFYAEVTGPDPGPFGPAFGLVMLEFLGGPFAALRYELDVPAVPTDLVFALNPPHAAQSFFSVRNPGFYGKLRGSQVICGNRIPPDAGLASLFEYMLAGVVTVTVDLEGGSELSGPVTLVYG